MHFFTIYFETDSCGIVRWMYRLQLLSVLHLDSNWFTCSLAMHCCVGGNQEYLRTKPPQLGNWSRTPWTVLVVIGNLTFTLTNNPRNETLRQTKTTWDKRDFIEWIGYRQKSIHRISDALIFPDMATFISRGLTKNQSDFGRLLGFIL